MKDFFELREGRQVDISEAVSKVKTTMPDKVASSATRFGLKAKTQGGHVSISGPKGKLNDFLRAIIGRSSYGNASELSESVEMNEETALAYQTPYGTATAYKRDTKSMRGKQDGYKLTLKTKSGKTVDLGSHPNPTKANVLSIVKNVMQKESVELEENKIFFVKVGDGRDSMTVKTKASNSREALKNVRAKHPKSRVSLDINQKQGQPAGTFESVEEAYRKPTAAEIAADKAKERRASGSKGPDSSARYKNIRKKMYGNAMGGLKKEESEATESTDNYRKSIDRIQAKKTRDSLTPSERDKLAKLHALMKKQRKTGNYKMESTDLEEKKFVVKYTHPTDKKSGKTSGPLSKAAADKKAAMGNRVDKVGGKYTVIPFVEGVELDEAKLSDMGIHNKIKDRNLLIKAIKTAEKMGGNMTGAVREIEKMQKGLSKHKAVQAALRQANESTE